MACDDTAGIAFANRVRIDMLRLWCAALSTETAKCRSSCPAWQVAFENNEVKESMAFHLAQGRLSTVCKAYNDLHDLLRQVGEVAVQIKLSPRLQDNPISKDGIAVAMHCLKETLVTATVLEGCDILRLFGHQTAGVTKAAAFLKKNKEARAGVPELLWAKLHALATEGLPMSAHTAAAADKPAAPADDASAGSVGASAGATCTDTAAAPARSPGVSLAVSAKREAAKADPSAEPKGKLRRMRSNFASKG